MIAVIADDFTGAAEIAGVGWRYGLKTVLQTEVCDNPGVDLAVVATDTRGSGVTEAVKQVDTVTHLVVEKNPQMIFKKIDSVLRGHISHELRTMMISARYDKALVIAGNPALKRTIKRGQYLIDERPLNETGFVSDPHFPMGSSMVLDIINAKEHTRIINQSVEKDLPEKGIVVGDVTAMSDLGQWAQKWNKEWLPVGSSVFFEAILKSKGYKKTAKNKTQTPANSRKVMVCGSMYPKPGNYWIALEKAGFVLVEMPMEVYTGKDDPVYKEWKETLLEKVTDQNMVITPPLHEKKDTSKAGRMREVFADVVKDLIDFAKPGELLVEGGSTLAAILKSLDIKQLVPVREIAPGVMQMKPYHEHNFFITSKPGSYDWSDEILNKNPKITT